jgi:hypothetical protein
MSAWVGYWETDVVFSGAAPSAHASSPGVERLFCGQCGTPLTFTSEVFPGELHVMVGTFDDPDEMVPQVHVWTDEKVSWLDADTHLPMKPKHGGMPRK